MDAQAKHQLLLTQLILMFQTAALQQMGKLKNPLLDKIEQNLEQAQISIDMIDMMHVKMKGSLSAEEERLFSTVLQELRLNYVDEVNKKQQQPPTAEPASSSPTANQKPAS